jgi:hypothetical protein
MTRKALPLSMRLWNEPDRTRGALHQGFEIMIWAGEVRRKTGLRHEKRVLRG